LIIGGIVLGIVILILAVLGLFRLRDSPKQQVSPRSHIVKLGYCNPGGVKPCLVSFSLDAENRMLVNLLIPAGYADFYMTISGESEENQYECKKLEEFPTHVTCTGKPMYPGAKLHFTLISTATGQTFAKGDFTMIGLLLPTTVAESTETPVTTETVEPTASPTSFLLVLPTRTPPATPSSYPNPSYYP
jgi:hypothetical protein